MTTNTLNNKHTQRKVNWKYLLFFIFPTSQNTITIFFSFDAFFALTFAFNLVLTICSLHPHWIFLVLSLSLTHPSVTVHYWIISAQVVHCILSQKDFHDWCLSDTLTWITWFCFLVEKITNKLNKINGNLCFINAFDDIWLRIKF